MSFIIDYQDHYSYVDSTISAYNFLKYSSKIWSLFSPALHYQNRLRHQDYRELFERSGFKIIEERRTEGSDDDLRFLRHFPINARFRSYHVGGLAIRNAHVVLRPQR